MNPYKDIRIRNNLTQKAMADLISVTPQVIVSIEAGLFNTPPESIREAFPNLVPDYYDWVANQRKENAPHFRKRPFPLAYSPNFDTLMKRVHESNRGFCRLLVYQPSLLSDYRRFRRSSQLLATALRQVQLSKLEVDMILEMPIHD